MTIEHVASAMLMPIGAYEDPTDPTGEMPWGRPAVCALPNGNTFVAVWLLKNTHTTALPEAVVTVRCWLLDPDLAVLDIINVQGANADAATESGGVRPVAFRVEDHTVWLLLLGNSWDSGSNSYVLHDQMVVINAKGSTLSVISAFPLAASESRPTQGHYNAMYYNGVDGNPNVVYFPEFNLVVLCGGDILTFRNGEIISQLTANEFAGYFAYGVATFRDPDDPTRFGTVIGDFVSTPSGYADQANAYYYSVDPVTGAVSETTEVLGTRPVNSDPDSGSDWYYWQQANTSPFAEDVWIFNSTNREPDTSQVTEIINARTFEKVYSDFEQYPGYPYYTTLYDDNPCVQGGLSTCVEMAWVVFRQNTGDTLGLRAAYIDPNVNPPRYEWTMIPMPFTTRQDDKHWDIFNEGNSAMDYFDGECVFASSVLDDSVPWPLDYDNSRADLSTIVVFKVKMGEKYPMRLETDDGFIRALGSGQMSLMTPDGWFREWSTEHDVIDFTQTRYPLKMKMPNGGWKTVQMFAPLGD